jgi:hypothetical protein
MPQQGAGSPVNRKKKEKEQKKEEDKGRAKGLRVLLALNFSSLFCLDFGGICPPRRTAEEVCVEGWMDGWMDGWNTVWKRHQQGVVLQKPHV